MMSIEKALAQAELISDDENWVRIEKYPYKSFYEDEEETFIDLEKREISDPSKNVSTLGENNSQLITFVMDRYADGVDLVDMLIQIQYKLQSGEESTAGPVNVYASNDKIKFGWAISNIQTQVAQTIQFIVYCTGRLADGESYLLKTKPMSYRIENTLGTGGYVEEPDENWFLQFENVMNEKVNQVASLASIAIDSAVGAKESEERVAEDRSVVEELAPQVRSDAEQSKVNADSAKLSEQNAEEWYNKTVERSGVNYASEELAGVVSPQDVYVNPENGKMHMTMETTETAMPNSYAGRLMVEEIGGVMEQDSTSGKNLLDCSGLTEQTINGVTFTPVYENGMLQYINANGTPTATAVYHANADTKLDVNKSYIITDGQNGHISTYYTQLYNDTISNLPNTFSGEFVPEDLIYAVRIIVKTAVSNLKFYPMIRLASVADATYEPFTNGPSPNPSYPQEIRKSVVSGIRTHGKNFADFQNAQNSDRGTFAYTKETAEKIVATKNASGGKFVARYVANLKADTTYNFSLTENAYQVYVYYDKLYGTAYKTFSNTNNATFTPTQDGVYVIGIFVPSSVASGSEVTVSNFMIEEGAEATPYEPYTESVITFSQPIELYGLEDVQDILNKQIGRKYEEVVFDGSDDEAWNGSSTIGRYYMNNFGCKGYGILMCSYAKGVQNGNEELNTCYIHAASNGRFIINTEIPTLAEWKAHLQANPMTVVYELAEETTEELPIADQIALNSLHTFDGITYIEFISDVQPTFKAEYGTSRVGGYTLEALLTARNADLKATAAQSTNEEV